MPSNIYGIADALHDPAYATGVGLLLWGAKYRGMQTWQRKDLNSGLHRFVSWIAKLFH